MTVLQFEDGACHGEQHAVAQQRLPQRLAYFVAEAAAGNIQPAPPRTGERADEDKEKRAGDRKAAQARAAAISSQGRYTAIPIATSEETRW